MAAEATPQSDGFLELEFEVEAPNDVTDAALQSLLDQEAGHLRQRLLEVGLGSAPFANNGDVEQAGGGVHNVGSSRPSSPRIHFNRALSAEPSRLSREAWQAHLNHPTAPVAPKFLLAGSHWNLRLGKRIREEWVERERQRRQQLEERKPFRASPVPSSVSTPRYAAMQAVAASRRRSHSADRSGSAREDGAAVWGSGSRSRPSSAERARLYPPPLSAEVGPPPPFKARPVPWSVAVPAYEHMLKQEQQSRQDRRRARSSALLRSSSLPPRLEGLRKRLCVQEAANKGIDTSAPDFAHHIQDLLRRGYSCTKGVGSAAAESWLKDCPPATYPYSWGGDCYTTAATAAPAPAAAATTAAAGAAARAASDDTLLQSLLAGGASGRLRLQKDILQTANTVPTPNTMPSFVAPIRAGPLRTPTPQLKRADPATAIRPFQPILGTTEVPDFATLHERERQRLERRKSQNRCITQPAPFSLHAPGRTRARQPVLTKDPAADWRFKRPRSAGPPVKSGAATPSALMAPPRTTEKVLQWQQHTAKVLHDRREQEFLRKRELEKTKEVSTELRLRVQKATGPFKPLEEKIDQIVNDKRQGAQRVMHQKHRDLQLIKERVSRRPLLMEQTDSLVRARRRALFRVRATLEAAGVQNVDRHFVDDELDELDLAGEEEAAEPT